MYIPFQSVMNRYYQRMLKAKNLKWRRGRGRKTFTNWINEQLSVSGRVIQDIEKDFCDGVTLVALVESLQFKKIGKVIPNPTGRIQMIQNVALACKAIMEDNVRLVNIGEWIEEVWRFLKCHLFRV